MLESRVTRVGSLRWAASDPKTTVEILQIGGPPGHRSGVSRGLDSHQTDDYPNRAQWANNIDVKIA